MPTYEECCTIYKLYDKLFAVDGNASYNTIKGYEGISNCVLMEKSDSLGLYQPFKESVLESDSSIGLEVNLEMYNYLLTLSVGAVAELQGGNRHWIHPTVDENKGCAKVELYAQKRPLSNIKTVIPITYHPILF